MDEHARAHLDANVDPDLHGHGLANEYHHGTYLHAHHGPHLHRHGDSYVGRDQYLDTLARSYGYSAQHA